MQTIADFIAAHGLTMAAEPTTHNEFMPDSDKVRYFHYRCAITRAPDGAAPVHWALTFSVGSGIVESWALSRAGIKAGYPAPELRHLKKEYGGTFGNWPPRNVRDRERYDSALEKAAKRYRPDLATVLDCLASDCATYDNARSFEEWASELGFDPDSRKAEKIYRACGDTYRALETLLGRDALQSLMFDTERE